MGGPAGGSLCTWYLVSAPLGPVWRAHDWVWDPGFKREQGGEGVQTPHLRMSVVYCTKCDTAGPRGNSIDLSGRKIRIAPSRADLPRVQVCYLGYLARA